MKNPLIEDNLTVQFARFKCAKESYSRSLLVENSGDSESFWRSVKKILPDAKQKSIPTCNQG